MIATKPNAVEVYDYAAEPKQIIACPLCGVTNPSQLRTDRFGYRVGLSRCACGLQYLNPRLSGAQYAQFYEQTYRPLLAYFYGRSQSELARRAADRRSAEGRGRYVAEALLRRVGAVNRLLDVGGGTGMASRVIAQALGCPSVTVLDPNVAEVLEAEQAGCLGIVGTPETMPATADPYDTIVCLQTADHWLEPLTALRWMRASCRKGGYLWLDIIDAPVRARRFPAAPRWKIDHPLYWSTASVLRAFALTGWSPLERFIPTGIHGRLWHRPGFLCQGV